MHCKNLPILPWSLEISNECFSSREFSTLIHHSDDWQVTYFFSKLDYYYILLHKLTLHYEIKFSILDFIFLDISPWEYVLHEGMSI